MNIRSCKAKGRRAAEEVRELLLQCSPSLVADDIRVTPSSVCGEDLWLSPKARLLYPFRFECKNVERLNFWEAIKQAEQHCKDSDYYPLVAFRRNHTKLRAIVDLELLLKFSHAVNYCE